MDVVGSSGLITHTCEWVALVIKRAVLESSGLIWLSSSVELVDFG